MGSGGCTIRRGTGAWLNASTTWKSSSYIGPRMMVRALVGHQMRSSYLLPFQDYRIAQFKALTFKNLRNLTIQSSSEFTTILPPPEFLSSITSPNLSEIIIDITVFPPGVEFDEALDAIKDYDGALCQLGNQLDPSSGSEKLVLILRVVEELPDHAAVLPRFSKSGILRIEAMGL